MTPMQHNPRRAEAMTLFAAAQERRRYNVRSVTVRNITNISRSASVTLRMAPRSGARGRCHITFEQVVDDAPRRAQPFDPHSDLPPSSRVVLTLPAPHPLIEVQEPTVPEAEAGIGVGVLREVAHGSESSRGGKDR